MKSFVTFEEKLGLVSIQLKGLYYHKYTPEEKSKQPEDKCKFVSFPLNLKNLKNNL